MMPLVFVIFAFFAVNSGRRWAKRRPMQDARRITG
jgi:hypothetical protein